MIFKKSVDVKRVSMIVTLLFTVVLFFAALLTELFQAPLNVTLDLNHFRLLFSPESFSDTTKFSLKNRIGTVSLIRIGQSDRWSITEPTPLPANGEIIQKLINTLRTIKVKETHSNDAINLTNYALSAPAIELSLTNGKGETTKLSFGLVNPIDNSTYLLDSSVKLIYQIDNILPYFERVSLPDFIDERPLPFTLADFKSIKIFRGEKSLRFELFKDISGTLFLKPNVPLKETHITNSLKSIFEMKSQKILDATESSKLLEGQLKQSYLTIDLELESSGMQNFKVSQFLSEIPEQKIERGTVFAVTNTKSGHIYLVNKDFFKNFSFVP